MLVMKLFG